MRRREFIALLGGTALTAPRTAFAQATDRMRRIGVLMPLVADDPEAKTRLGAFLNGLQQLGWTEGRNLRIDARWPGSDADRFRKYAAELVALEPDVILASSTSSVAALQRITRSVPIVFAAVIDPVGAGFVASLARPGGNITGFQRVRIRPKRKMARTAQRNGAQPDASCRPSRSRTSPPGSANSP